jgi:PAS domain S-box-containing protein
VTDAAPNAGRRAIGPEPGPLLGAIFSTSPDAIIVVDRNGTIVLANPSVTGLFGYYPEELVGASIETLLPIDRRSVHQEHLTRFFAEPHPRQMGVGRNLAGRQRDGEEFPVDVSLAPVEVRGRHYVAAFVRDAAEQLRAVNRLHAVNEITQRLLGGSDPDEVLPAVAATARELSRSDAVWIVLPNDADGLEIAVADGAGTDTLLGLVLSAESSRSARVLHSGSSETIEDLSTVPTAPPQYVALDLGPGLYVPLVAEDRHLGTLVLGRARGEPGYSPLDVAFAEVFATSITAAIVLAKSRAELDRLGILAEDERIARDLHDTVIQQLFALGMSLQATRFGIEGVAAARIDDAVDRLDEVIREIRNTIFRLPAQASGDEGFRAAVLRCVEAKREQLGFAPRVAFEGPVDAAVPDDVAAHVLSVLSEALSNVARHAGASFAEAVVSLQDDQLEVVVVDDGKGIDGAPTAGSGIRNLTDRARQLGGAATLRPRDPRGTILEWRVPLRRG